MVVQTGAHMLEASSYYPTEDQRVFHHQAMMGAGRVFLTVQEGVYSSVKSSTEQAQRVQGMVLKGKSQRKLMDLGVSLSTEAR